MPTARVHTVYSEQRERAAALKALLPPSAATHLLGASPPDDTRDRNRGDAHRPIEAQPHLGPDAPPLAFFTDARPTQEAVDAACEALQHACGPLPYLDLDFQLTFEAANVEVWVDRLPPPGLVAQWEQQARRQRAGAETGPEAASSPTVPHGASFRFLFLLEPDAITRLAARARKVGHLFYAVFTHRDDLLAFLPHARRFEHGGTWVPREVVDAVASAALVARKEKETCLGDEASHVASPDEAPPAVAPAAGVSSCVQGMARALLREPRPFHTSFVCGGKRRTRGHRLRQALLAAFNEAAAAAPGTSGAPHCLRTPLRLFSSSALPPPSVHVSGSGRDGDGDRGGGAAAATGAAGAVESLEPAEPTPVVVLKPAIVPETLRLPAPPIGKVLALTGMFHLAIENVRQTNYFTEKLLDCFLTRTVPIYWGCPNIGDYFDEAGMILISPNPSSACAEAAAVAQPGKPSEGSTDGSCRSPVEQNGQPQTSQQAKRGDDDDDDDDETVRHVLACLNGLSAQDYTSRRVHIDRNFELARRWIDQNGRMQKAIEGALGSEQEA